MLKIRTHPHSDAPPGGGASRRLASPALWGAETAVALRPVRGVLTSDHRWGRRSPGWEVWWLYAWGGVLLSDWQNQQPSPRPLTPT